MSSKKKQSKELVHKRQQRNGNVSLTLYEKKREEILLRYQSKRHLNHNASGHGSELTSIVLTPDDKFCVTGSRDNTAALWHIETGKCVRKYECDSTIQVVSVVPNGSLLLAGDSDGNIILWDIGTGKRLYILKGHAAQVACLAVCYDSKYCVSGSFDWHDDGQLILWNLQIRRPERIWKGDESICSVAFTPDSRYVIAGHVLDHAKGAIMVHDVAANECIREIRDLSAVWCMDISADGNYLVTGHEDHTARLWRIDRRIDEWECIQVLEGHTATVHTAKFLPGKDMLATGCQNCNALVDRTIRVWDISTGQLHRTLDLEDDASCIDITSDARYVVACGHRAPAIIDLKKRSSKKTICPFNPLKVKPALLQEDQVLLTYDRENMHLLDLNTGDLVWNTKISGRFEDIKTLGRNDHLYVVGSDSDGLRFCDLKSGRHFLAIKTEKSWSPRFDITKNGKFAVIEGRDGKIQIWDVNARKCCIERKVHERSITYLGITPDDTKAISCGCDKTPARLWDIATGECLRIFDGLTESFYSGQCRFVPGTPQFVCACGNSAEMWNYESGKKIRRYVGHSEDIQSIAITSDRKRVITGGSDEVIMIWDTMSGQCLKTLTGHTTWIETLTTTPDGQFLISEGAGRETGIWILKTGECAKILEREIEPQLVSDGSTLITTNIVDHSVNFWTVPDAQHLGRLFVFDDGSFLWKSCLTSQGSASPHYFYTNREDLVTIYESELDGKNVRVVNQAEARFKERFTAHNRQDIVMARINNDMEKYQKLIGEDIAVKLNYAKNKGNILMSKIKIPKSLPGSKP